MSELCTSLNFWQNRNITENFVQYVILAFILTSCITIIIVLCLVKYITYNMKQDLERERRILEQKFKPARTDESPEESDEEFTWAIDSKNQEDERPHHDVGYSSEIIDKDLISLHSNLETNYVGDLSIEGSSDNESDEITNNIDHVYLQLHSQNKIQIFSPYSILTETYVTRASMELKILNFSSLLLYNDTLIKINRYRSQLVFPQLLNFILDILYNLHSLDEEGNLSMKTKYEQKMEKLNCDNDFNVVCQGNKLLSISDTFVRDVDAVIENDEMHNQILASLHSQPLDVLKIFLSILEHINEQTLVNSKAALDGIKICRKLCYMVKKRISCVQQALNDLSKGKIHSTMSKIISDFKLNINEVCIDFQQGFMDAIEQIREFQNLHSEENQQFFLKIEEDINRLKLDVIHSSEICEIEKVRKFNEMMIALLVSYFQDGNYFTTSIQSQVKTIKSVMNNLQKQTFSKMSHVEEALFLSLKEDCNISEDQILSITQSIQDSLKTAIKQYVSSISDSEAMYLENLTTYSATVCNIIEYIIKAVSARYKRHMALNTNILQLHPSIPIKVRKEMTIIVNSELSKTALNVVSTLVLRLFTDMSNMNIATFKLNAVNVNNFHENIQSMMEDSDHLHDLRKPLQGEVLKQLQGEVFKQCNSITSSSFEETSSRLEEILRTKMMNSVNDTFFQNILVYNNVRKQFLSGANCKKDYAKKDSKYLSRKGSSYKEKSQQTKLLELYQGLLEVKEHKYREFYQKQQFELNNTKSPIESGGNFCVKYLTKQQKLLNETSRIAILQKELNSLDRYYMREMLLKKMEQFYDDNSIETPHGPSVSKKSSNKNRNPKLPPSLEVKKSSGTISTNKKTSFLPKKRKSRKIADTNEMN